MCLTRGSILLWSCLCREINLRVFLLMRVDVRSSFTFWKISVPHEIFMVYNYRDTDMSAHFGKCSTSPHYTGLYLSIAYCLCEHKVKLCCPSTHKWNMSPLLSCPSLEFINVKHFQISSKFWAKNDIGWFDNDSGEPRWVAGGILERLLWNSWSCNQ